MAFVAHDTPFEVRLCCTWCRKQGLACKRRNRLEQVTKAAISDLVWTFPMHPEDSLRILYLEQE